VEVVGVLLCGGVEVVGVLLCGGVEVVGVLLCGGVEVVGVLLYGCVEVVGVLLCLMAVGLCRIYSCNGGKGKRFCLHLQTKKMLLAILE
jgi:hypothetical protein